MQKLILILILIFIMILTFLSTASAIVGGTDIAGVQQPAKTDSTVYIRGIEIYGNVATRPEILKRFFAFDTGMALDTSLLRVTRANLLKTKLYDKVDVFPHLREDGAYVFVVLKEAVRLDLTYGVTYSTHKYGYEDLWFYAEMDVTQYNFRGRLEMFSAGVSLWHYKSLRFSWFKPFLSTPYFISIGAGVADYPGEVLPVHYTDVYAKFTIGMDIGKYSRAGLSGIPIFRYRSVVESMMPKEGAAIPNPDMNSFYEAFGAVSFSHDRRSSRFDPQKGWYLSSEIRTNHLYGGVNTPFVQAKGDVRYYLPLLFDDMAALRLAVTARNTEADAYHRLTYGSAGDIRGYNVEELGWNFIANSSILASVKYHKPLYKSPRVPIPFINLIFDGVNTIQYRIDGTLIADYARLYHDPFGAITFNGDRQEGLGLGFGIRGVVPDVRQSGCIDMVFGKDGKSDRWKSVLHVYLDLFF